MKLKGIAAGAALFVVGFWSLDTAQAASYLHLQHEDGRIGVWELDVFRLKTTLVYDPPRAMDGDRLKGVYDFDGDGDVDLVFEDPSQRISLWQLESGTRVSIRELGELSEDERLIWVGDWNAGQGPALLTIDRDRAIKRRQWNESDGMSAPTSVASAGDDYRFVAATDLDGDGLSDLLMVHPAGRIVAWLLSSEGEFKETVEWELDPSYSADWQIVGAADLDKNRGVDVVLQHTDGRFAVWPLVFPEFLDFVELSEAPDDAGWRVAVMDSITDEAANPRVSNRSSARIRGPIDTSPLLDLEAVSFGNPNAKVNFDLDRWWRQHRKPFLEIWTP